MWFFSPLRGPDTGGIRIPDPFREIAPPDPKETEAAGWEPIECGNGPEITGQQRRRRRSSSVRQAIAASSADDGSGTTV